MFENPRRGKQARNFTTNAPQILGIKSSSEQIFSRKLPLGAPVDLSKCQGTEEVCSLYRGFVTSKACLKFVIFVEFDSGVFGELKG